jgi:hypothetical protein
MRPPGLLGPLRPVWAVCPIKRPPALQSLRTLEPPPMTVCIAALCENGRKFVVATDRRLAFAGIATDSLPGKMFWFGGDWIFLYSGAPSRVELINEEMRKFPKFDRTTRPINDAKKSVSFRGVSPGLVANGFRGGPLQLSMSLSRERCSHVLTVKCKPFDHSTEFWRGRRPKPR